MARFFSIEELLLLLPTLLVAASLAPHWPVEAAALLALLFAAAVCPEPAARRRGASSRPPPAAPACCSYRPANSHGLALGCASVPLVLAALSAVRLAADLPAAAARAHLWAAMGCAAQPLWALGYSRGGSPLPPALMPGAVGVAAVGRLVATLLGEPAAFLALGAMAAHGAALHGALGRLVAREVIRRITPAPICSCVGSIAYVSLALSLSLSARQTGDGEQRREVVQRQE